MNTMNIENNLDKLIEQKTKLEYRIKSFDTEMSNKLFKLNNKLDDLQYLIHTLQEAQKEIQANNDQPCDHCTNLCKGIQWCMKNGCLEGTTTNIQYPLFQSNNEEKINDQIVQDLKSNIQIEVIQNQKAQTKPTNPNSTIPDFPCPKELFDYFKTNKSLELQTYRLIPNKKNDHCMITILPVPTEPSPYGDEDYSDITKEDPKELPEVQPDKIPAGYILTSNNNLYSVDDLLDSCEKFYKKIPK